MEINSEDMGTALENQAKAMRGREKERRGRTASESVAAAYSLAKGLSSLMVAIERQIDSLPASEHDAIRSASQAAFVTLVQLNQIIIDTGNMAPVATRAEDAVD